MTRTPELGRVASEENALFPRSHSSVSPRSLRKNRGPAKTAKGPRGSDVSNLISWKILAEIFDRSGTVYDHHKGHGRGWQYRLRLPSYHRKLLEEVQRFLDAGSISTEQKPKGPYYRLELGGLGTTGEVLQRMLPYLQVKKRLVEQWLRNH